MMYIKIALCLRAYVEIRIRAAASRDGGYMNPNTQEPGPFSETYFHTPSPLAKKTFLYPVCLGHYYCDEEYCVARNNYDSFLMMLVVKGQGYAESLGEKAFRKKIGEKQLVLMDCYAPHMYGADSEMEFYWIHFDGINAGAYFRYLTEVYGTVLTLTDSQANVFLHKFRMLLEALSSDQGIAENLLGYFVTDLLTFPSGLTGARTVSGSEAAQEDRFTRELARLFPICASISWRKLLLRIWQAAFLSAPIILSVFLKSSTGSRPTSTFCPCVWTAPDFICAPGIKRLRKLRFPVASKVKIIFASLLKSRRA